MVRVFDSNTLKVRLPCDVSQLPILMEQIEAFAKRHAWKESENMQVQLIVEEWVVNAMTHGAQGKSNDWVCVVIQSAPDAFNLELTDNGIPYDPNMAKSPDTNLDLDSRTIGGYGVHFVRQMSDSLDYARIKHNGEDINQLSIIKKRY